MDSRIKRPGRSAVSLGLGAALLVSAGVVATTPVMSALASQSSVARAAAARPATAVTAHATVLRAPTAVSTLTGTGVHAIVGDCASVNACSLVARTGSVTVNGQPLTVWKFAPASADALAGARSAVLVGQVDQPMTITLHNALGAPVGLSIPQLDFDSAQAGLQPAGVDSASNPTFRVANAGGDATYTFTPRRPGTYLYQAALTGDGSRQVAMGLVGALIVRPATSAATPYDTAETVVNDEALMVYTDIDSRLAAAAETSQSALNQFNMRNYRPDYHLINGVAYPDAATTIPTDHGHQLLLRVVNGSILEKSPTILGTRMAVFAKSARPLPATLNVSGRLLATGDTFDAVVQMPPAPANSRYAIYDAPGVLSNGTERAVTSPAAATPVTRSPNALAMGGALAFIDNGATGAPSAGPVVTGFAAAGQPGGTGRPLTLSATISTVAPGAVVTKAELYVDSLGATAVPVGLTAQGASVGISLPPMDVHTWTTGTHTLWLRGISNNGGVETAGPFASISVRIDNTGPAVVGLALSSSHVNGKSDVAITASLDERNTGGGLAGGPFGTPATGTGARFWVDGSATVPTAGFAKVDIPTNGPRSVASVDGVLTQAQMAGLTDGTHTLWVEGRDDLGQWGAAEKTDLVIDRTAPVTTQVTLNPAATNGLFSPNKPGNVTITATVSDTANGSRVTTVEGYVGTVKDSGSADSLYFSPLGGDVWQADMPLAWLASYTSDQDIPIIVVGTDAAGNRSKGLEASATAKIRIDRTPPTVVLNRFATRPRPTTVLRIRGAVTDVAAPSGVATSGIAFAEWFIGADPGLGKGHRITATYGPGVTQISDDYSLIGTGLSGQQITVTLRTMDRAGNVATATPQSVRIGTIPAAFVNGFAAADPQQWTAGPLGVPGAALILPVGKTAGQRALSVTLGAVGYYEKSLTGVVADNSLAKLNAGFSLVLGRTYPGCSSAAASSCKPVTVFTGVGANGRDVVTVQYQRRSATSAPLFRVVAATGTKLTAGRWTAVPVAAGYSVTVGWTSSTKGGAVLRVNKTAVASVSANTASLRVATVRLGILKAASRASGRILVDTFYLV